MRWLVLFLAACARPYHGGTLPAASARLACVDVWLEETARPEAEGPVLIVHLGNRCDHSTQVDLGSIRVVGLDGGGATWNLAPYDPDGEIEPRRIDAYVGGDEWIEYHAASGRPSLVALDVDVGSVEAPGPARWIRLAVMP